MKTKMLYFAVTAILLAFVAGCNQEVERDTTPAEQTNGTEVEELTWTDNPTVEMIPDTPVKGEANGAEFIAADIYFEPRFGDWRMVITDKKLPAPDSMSSGGQSINIDMPEEPQAGSIFTKSLEYGNGYFQINKRDNPEETTSWNADNAYAIEITHWEADEYDPDGELFQLAGKASGKVFVVYSGEGWEGFDNSWAAGTFTDVPVRYLGEPDLD